MHPRDVAARRLALALIFAGMLLWPAAASAGRLLATGHDVDHHCGREGEADAHAQCHFFQVAVDYVRAAAPGPTKPVLVLDRGELDVVTSLDRVYGKGTVERKVVSPRSDEFRTTPISTELYSAVIIASSRGWRGDRTPQDLNEFDSTPDSDAINARAADLRAFFNDGGGIFVNSGNQHGDDPTDPYYAFLPVSVRGARAAYPFVLTEAGRALGLTERDITCCPTHNTFEQPSSESAWRALDTDANGRIVSMFAEAPRFSALADPAVTPATRQELAAGLPAAKACLRRRALRLRVRRPRGLRLSRARIYMNGKLVKRLRGKRVTRRVTLPLPMTASRTVKVRIVVFTTGRRKITIRRTYRICR